MKLILLALLFAAGHSAAKKVRYDNYRLYSLTPKNAEALKALKQLEDAELPGFNFWSPVVQVGSPVEVMVSPYLLGAMNESMRGLDVEAKLLMADVQKEIDSQEASSTSRNNGFGWTRYHTLTEINSWLLTLIQRYPGIVSPIETGRTYENRPIRGVRVSFSPNNANNSIFIESTIHAREWITAATVTYILNELLNSTDASVRQLAQRYDWYIFPVFNPDGYIYSHTTDRMWRKTRTPHSVLCAGADPNRNWDYFWNHGGTSNSPCSQTYRGPAPFSEPSCRTMAEYIATVAPRLVAYLSFHSFTQLLLIPYGYTSDLLDNYPLAYDIGVKSVEALARRYGTQYRVGTVYDTIYPASGSSADWVKGTFQVPLVYTYELRDQGQYGFLLPPEQIIPTGEETLDSLVTMMAEFERSRLGTTSNA